MRSRRTDGAGAAPRRMPRSSARATAATAGFDGATSSASRAGVAAREAAGLGGATNPPQHGARLGVRAARQQDLVEHAGGRGRRPPCATLSVSSSTSGSSASTRSRPASCSQARTTRLRALPARAADHASRVCAAMLRTPAGRRLLARMPLDRRHRRSRAAPDCAGSGCRASSAARPARRGRGRPRRRRRRRSRRRSRRAEVLVHDQAAPRARAPRPAPPSRSHGISVRRSMTSASTPASSAAASQRSHHRAPGDDGDVVALAA